MKHNLKISVSKVPQTGGVVTCRRVNVRERFLRFLFGNKQKLTILIPGDGIDEVSICESARGGKGNGKE